MADYIDARTLAEKLKVRVETVNSWTHRGQIPCVRVNKKIVRYSLAEVISALSIPTRKKGVKK